MAETRQSITRLREEHVLIVRVLDGMEYLARRIEQGRAVPPALIAGVVDFFGQFADGRHHAREDEALFPLLERLRPAPPVGMLDRMRVEHAEAREGLRVLAQALAAPADGAALAGAVRAYAQPLRQHLVDEDEGLFRYAERTLSADADHQLAAAFAAIDARQGGPGAYEALCEVGRALEAACRATAEPSGPATVVGEVMRPNVHTLGPEESLGHAAELMDTLAVRELPVVEHGTLVGILAHRDLQPHRGHLEWTTVRAAMTPRPVTVEPHTPIHDAARLLLERCFNAVPVATGGVLVGMIGRADLVRHLVGLLG